MLAAGLCYWIDSFALFLAIPDVPDVLRVTLVAELSLALWLFVVGVNEPAWRAQVQARLSALRAANVDSRSEAAGSVAP
jgi:hypothetical protein